jgi:hypothetical protein
MSAVLEHGILPMSGATGTIMEKRSEPGRLLSWYTPVWRHRTVVGLLFLMIFLTYQPALGHPPRQDQWPFLLDTVHEDHFLPLLIHTYSYNRTRVIAPGDYPLFRPGLFALLCAEKALFGARYPCWQCVGIALHCAVVWVFLRLLLLLHRTYPTDQVTLGRLRLGLAYILPLFFAVNLFGLEMVSWCHIHGYVMFILLIISGWLILFKDLSGVAQPGGWWWRHGSVYLLTLLAAFTYETGGAYALCLGAVLALGCSCRGQMRKGILVFILFASILPMYLTVNWMDQLVHPNSRADRTEEKVFEKARWGPTLDHARRYLVFTLGEPFFPSCPKWRFENRLVMPEAETTPRAYWCRDPFLFLSYAVVLASVGFASIQLGRILVSRQRMTGSFFLLLPVSLILLQLTIVVLGRMNVRPESLALPRQSYYAYPPFLSLLVCIYYLWIRVPRMSLRAAPIVLVLILGGLGVLSMVSARKVYLMNDKIRRDTHTLHTQITYVQGVIDRYGNEPGFGISFDPDLFYSLQVVHGLTVLEILFAQRINNENPTHIICSEGRHFRVLKRADYEQLYGEPRYLQLGVFVKFDGDANMVFRDQQGYYGLPWQAGRFRSTVHKEYYKGLVE